MHGGKRGRKHHTPGPGPVVFNPRPWADRKFVLEDTTCASASSTQACLWGNTVGCGSGLSTGAGYAALSASCIRLNGPYDPCYTTGAQQPSATNYLEYIALQADVGVMEESGYTHCVPWGVKVEASFYPGCSYDFEYAAGYFMAGTPEVLVGWFIDMPGRGMDAAECFGDTASTWQSKKAAKMNGKATTTMRAGTHVGTGEVVLPGYSASTKTGHLKRYYDIGELFGMQKGVLRENPLEAVTAGYGTTTLNSVPTITPTLRFYTQSPGIGTVGLGANYNRMGYSFPDFKIRLKITHYCRFFNKQVFAAPEHPEADLRLLRSREEGQGELDDECDMDVDEEEWVEE